MQDIRNCNQNMSIMSSSQHANITLDLGRKGAPQYFAEQIERGIKKGILRFKLRVPDGSSRAFPNTCAPIAGLVDHYREKHNCTFFWSRKAKRNSHATKTGILHPYRFPLETRGVNCLDKVWAFDSESHYETVRGIVDSIRASAPIGQDLINCLELCLNEITDNVLNHSANDEESATGFVMAQVHREKQRIAVAVFDRGIGILESLRRSGRAVSSSSDAISLAVKKGISDGKGAGKGLWILEQIIIDNEGSFEITSDGSRYSLRHLEKKREPKLAQTKIATRIPGTTLIDFQLNTANPTSISRAISGYKHVDLWAEAHEENDDGSILRFKVNEDSPGLGSRIDARRFANIISNAPKMAESIVLDFSGISIVSSSYADELIMSLSKQLGFSSLMSKIRFRHLSEDCARMFDDAMESRLGNRD